MLITLVNLFRKAKKEAAQSITPLQMTYTSRVNKLEKMEEAAVTESGMTGYICSLGSSICGVILISMNAEVVRPVKWPHSPTMHQREIKSAPSSFVSPPSLFAAALGIVREFLLWCTWRHNAARSHAGVCGKLSAHIFNSRSFSHC